MSQVRAEATIAALEKHADEIRQELKVPRQSEVFRSAVEAGYLAALADGEVDATERETIVRAVELLSVGAVIEWEADALIEGRAGRAKKEGAAKRAAAGGAALERLGQSVAGLAVTACAAPPPNRVDHG